MRRLRWGVLSTASIGWVKVIPGIQRGERSEVVAIASRDAALARRAADEIWSSGSPSTARPRIVRP